MSDLLIGLSIFGVFAFWLAGFINSYVFKAYITRAHPALAERWIPKPWERNSAAHLRYLKYLVARGYGSTGDAGFIRRCDLHRGAHLCWIAGMGLLFVGVLSWIGIQRHRS